LPIEGGASDLVDAVRKTLEAAGRLQSVEGQQAVELANRIVSAPGMNMGVAALSKELSRTMASAVAGVEPVGDVLDELKRRRDEKRAKR
jgi:hypothetical protein